jgi:hypothetical protein
MRSTDRKAGDPLPDTGTGEGTQGETEETIHQQQGGVVEQTIPAVAINEKGVK